MLLINHINDPQTKAFAKHCLEEKTAEQLRAAAKKQPDEGVISEWGITEGQYEEAIAAALAELEA
ncbi:hypothetical protein DFP85_105146 [Halomonas ventosae]|uniref:Uncharacterized protein n=1 Tax=Halomonas ventosae TaxID=229007 RepID=A0A4R6ZU23_9GAMM|nr:hypothetical protein [Halomonas ventosae]TDR55972.1 hypothetical protein DFP85_105146 [Halomonas ventosae]